MSPKGIHGPFASMMPYMYRGDVEDFILDGANSDARHAITSQYMNQDSDLDARTPNDSINRKRTNSEKILLEYRVQRNSVTRSYPVITVSDLDGLERVLEARPESFIGTIAERIARISLGEYLEHTFGDDLNTQIEDQREESRQRYARAESYTRTVENSEDCILQIRDNGLVLVLQKHEEEATQYKPKALTEIDGLWTTPDYLVVLESKIGKVSFSKDAAERLAKKRLDPLQELYPERKIVYITLATKEKLLMQTSSKRGRHRLRQHPVTFARTLQEAGYACGFSCFRESSAQIKDAANHVVREYDRIKKGHPSAGLFQELADGRFLLRVTPRGAPIAVFAPKSSGGYVLKRP